MKTKRILALFLMLAMLIGMMPTMVLDLHAEEHAWNPNATMTLSCGDEVIEPAEVIETADTKLKIYHVESINDYTLTTSADNDYAVLFEISLTVLEEDEYGYKDYDYEMTITLDNVHIATYNPRADQNAGVHAAMMFSDRTAENRYETLTIELVGDNTVELLGVENDSDADVWSAVAFAAPNTVINGEGTLNATCRYDGAVGAVSAVYTENTIGLYDTVTLNATADVKAQQADKLMGDGLYFHNMNFISEAGTTVNVQASGSGIVHNTETVLPKYLDNLDVGGDLHIRAADYGINWPAGRIYLGDGASMSIAGLTEGSAANVGILTRRDVSIGENCNVTIDALGAAFSCQVTTTANPSAPLSIGKSSVVRMSGSVTSSDFVIDCGTKLSGTNNVVSGTGEEWYGESWNFSELVLAENAQLTIAGGYRALQAAAMELNTGASLTVVTTDVVDSTSVYEYGPVYLSTNSSYIYSGATFSVETPAPTAVYGYSKLNLESNDVYIKAGKTAISNTVARGTGIFTFESDNGATWVPFANSSKKAYFTTREPATHTCAASRAANSYSEKVWTPIEGEHKHTATCIYCAAEIVADCQWDRGAWTYNSGVYTLKFECEICEQERYSDVEYHSHVYETWTAMTGTTSPMHESTCTVPGCGASTEDYCSNSYGPEYHINYNTMRKDCTKCGQYTVWEFDSSQISTTHVQAKPASCAGVGNVEFWYCEHCNCYYADESCTSVLDPAHAFIQPTGHTYGADGLCTACGHKNRTLSFVPEEDFPDQYEYYYVMIGKTSQGKYYVLGNNTVNGKREAVLIPDELIAADGTITLSADMAEFLYRETVGTSNVAWMADGGCFTFTAKDGFYLYDKAHYGDGCVPYPGYFYPGYDYDQPGKGKMYAYDKDYSKRVWMYFDEENLCFDVSESEIDNVYIYIQLCDHENLAHNPAVKPTCTEQGSREYYCCEKCYSYFADANASTPYEFPEYIDPYDFSAINEYFLLPATGHKFDSEGVCEYCTMKRNVYKPITSLEQFDQLSEDAYYIIVFKDGDKTYAAFLPDIGHINDPVTIDANNNGIVDLMEPDANANGIPDCIESYIDEYMGSVDYNEDGIKSVEEYNEMIGWMDDDEDIDADDYRLFFENRIYWDLYYEYDYEISDLPNIVEVTVAPDGSITIVDEGAMEFQMMPSGIWGGQEHDDSELEYEGIQENERLRAAWVPNWWIANYGTMGEYSEDHFLTQNRWYGDRSMPGVIDNKNWRISFNEDGTALLVSTWSTFDDSAALQLVKYTDADGNERITMVGCYGELWQYSDILSNCTVISGAYLYASEPTYEIPPHDCVWGEWENDETTDTHTRKCTFRGCTEKQTEAHNWNDGVETEAPTCTETGVKTFTCSNCQATRTEDIPNCDHAYVWMEGKTSTCIEEGIVPHYHCDGCGKNFDENYGEITSVALPLGSHEYGEMYWGRSANFWEDGNIEYCQCETCEKYFDVEYNEVETPVIPKYSTNLSICVNGTPTALVIGEQHENFISWSLEGLSVTKGDVITICQTDNAEISHNYFADGNVDNDGKILTTATAANVVLTATPNGLMLFIDGYKYEGIVIEINGVQYPMIYTSYPDETTTYIYGYVNFAVGDKFVIVDNVSGTVYDYDDLDEGYLWDTWDFHRGDNGEFVIDYACRYGIEFDYGGDKKIYINKTFASLDGSSYELNFENTDIEKVSLEQMQFETGSEAYEDLMWYYDHEDVVNKEDIVSYIGEKGLYVYIVKLQLEEGTKFNIKNLTVNSTINSEHLVEVYTENGSLTKDGDYVKVLKNGYYSIVYMPCFNSFMVEAAEPPADVYMYLDGDFVSLYKDDDGVVTYEGLVADTSTNIMFTDSTYTTYLPITLDSNTDSTIAHAFQSGSVSMLFFDKAGTYNLAYNVETGVLSITSVGGDGGEDTEFDPSKYLYYLSVSGGSGSTQTIVMQAGDSNEVCAKNETLTASCFIGVIEMTKDGSTSTTYGALADTDTSIAQSYGTVAMVKIAGTYDVYFNTDAKTIKLVAVTSGSTEEKAMPKDIYIRYDNILILSESPENADELCYLGLEMGAWDEFQIRDTDKNYIADITLAEGTTGVVTNGTKITFQVGGTFDIYINKTTHEIRIVAAHECTWSDWSSNGDGTHTRACRCNASETKDCIYDDGVVTEQPSHVEPGTKLYTCTVCGHTYEEEIPVLPDHEWGEWLVNKTDEANTHIRYCICDEVQSAPHNFDAGVVTEKPTHTEKGLVTFTCADCNYTYTEEIPETEEHAFGDWQPDATVSGKHYRECACGERESGDCIWDEGVPGVGTVEGSYFMDYTCTVCGAHSTKDVRGSRVHFENCEGMNQNPLTFIQTSDEATYQLTLPTAQDVAQREGYVLIGWQASIDGVTYAPGAELYISYEENPTITFSAVWAQVLGQGEQKLSKDQAYVTDMEAFELEGEGVTYRGDQVFYVPKDGIYALIDAKNDKEVE